MLKSPYHDQTHFHPDGTWWMNYSPKVGGMALAANAALIRCMTDSEPLLVLKQISDKAIAETRKWLPEGFVHLLAGGQDHPD